MISQAADSPYSPVVALSWNFSENRTTQRVQKDASAVPVWNFYKKKKKKNRCVRGASVRDLVPTEATIWLLSRYKEVGDFPYHCIIGCRRRTWRFGGVTSLQEDWRYAPAHLKTWLEISNTVNLVVQPSQFCVYMGYFWTSSFSYCSVVISVKLHTDVPSIADGL